jgi:hypothetical protein
MNIMTRLFLNWRFNMFRIRHSFLMGIVAASLVCITSTGAMAQSGPSGPSPSGAAGAPQSNRIVFTKESLPQMLKQLGYTVTEKNSGNVVYWQVVTQSENWNFTVQVMPMMNQDKITCILLTSDLGRKIPAQANAQEVLKVLQYNHAQAYLMYFGFNAQTGCITAQRPYIFNDASSEEMRQMFNDFFKSIRDTHAVWNAVSNAPAAAPAATPTATPQPAADNVVNVAGTSWTGKENLPGFGKLTFVFRAGGAATMIDAKGQTEGTFTQNGNDVTINFNGCVYQGRINGQALAGSGRITSGTQSGQTWSFQLALQKN